MLIGRKMSLLLNSCSAMVIKLWGLAIFSCIVVLSCGLFCNVLGVQVLYKKDSEGIMRKVFGKDGLLFNCSSISFSGTLPHWHFFFVRVSGDLESCRGPLHWNSCPFVDTSTGISI